MFIVSMHCCLACLILQGQHLTTTEWAIWPCLSSDLTKSAIKVCSKKIMNVDSLFLDDFALARVLVVVQTFNEFSLI